jgi:dTDP-glucose 4,6-dehydratase
MVDGHPEYWPRVKVLTHDLTAPLSPLLCKKIGLVDHVISMASLSDVHASIQDPVPFVKANVDIALNMLEYARVAKPRTFLQISTDEVYGPTDGNHLHAEWESIVPSNPYSASKAAQEAIAISYWRSYGMPLIIVNLMNNFGEMQSPAKFPAIVQRKVRAGETITIHGNEKTVGSRYYIHSRNSADAFLFLLRDGPAPHLHQDSTADKPDRYNIVGDKQIDNISLAKLIADEIGKPLIYKLEDAGVSRPGHDLHYGLDGSKLARLGWTSPKPLEESMRETVAWYQSNPEWLE